MVILRKQTLMHTVKTDDPVRRSYARLLVCKHTYSTKYVHVDHRGGPGAFADSWQGLVCVNCGAIMSRERLS